MCKTINGAGISMFIIIIMMMIIIIIIIIIIMIMIIIMIIIIIIIIIIVIGGGISDLHECDVQGRRHVPEQPLLEDARRRAPDLDAVIVGPPGGAEACMEVRWNAANLGECHITIVMLLLHTTGTRVVVVTRRGYDSFEKLITN
jgi:hypothetical protein